MEILELISQYGIINIIIGFIATLLCGCIKIPIVNTIKLKTYSEKEAAEKLRSYCTLIVSIISSICVIVLAIITHNYNWSKMISDILLSITCSKVIYALYEGKYNNGEGIISIKAWMHKLINTIKAKCNKEIPDNIKDAITIIQETLIEETHLPLTDEQIQALGEALKKKDF